MNQQHTPAPWSTSCLPNGTEWTVSFEDGDMLADLTGCPNEAANAKLIAAAPELLACLCEMLGAAEMDCMDDKSNVWRNLMSNAQVAIAKATGEQA